MPPKKNSFKPAKKYEEDMKQFEYKSMNESDASLFRSLSDLSSDDKSSTDVPYDSERANKPAHEDLPLLKHPSAPYIPEHNRKYIENKYVDPWTNEIDQDKKIEESTKMFDVLGIYDDSTSGSSGSSEDWGDDDSSGDDKKPSPEEMEEKRLKDHKKTLFEAAKKAKKIKKNKDDEWEKMQNKDIEKKWRGTHTCAVCGKSNLKPGERMQQFTEIKIQTKEGDSKRIGKKVYPYIDRVCKECYNSIVRPALLEKEIKKQGKQLKKRKQTLKKNKIKRNESRRRRRQAQDYAASQLPTHGMLLTSLGSTMNEVSSDEPVSSSSGSDSKKKGGKRKSRRKRKKKKRTRKKKRGKKRKTRRKRR